MGRDMDIQVSTIERQCEKGEWQSSRQAGLNSHFLSSAAITKCHRLGGLNNSNLFLTVLEVGKSKIKMLADLGA